MHNAFYDPQKSARRDFWITSHESQWEDKKKGKKALLNQLFPFCGSQIPKHRLMLIEALLEKTNVLVE